MFRVTIKFTGVCGFVPRDISGGQKDFAYCVVMPNAWYDEKKKVCPDPNKKGIDGFSKLRPHRAFFHFDAGRIKGSPAEFKDVRGVHFLDSESVLIIPKASTLQKCTDGNLDGLARFDDITSASTQHLLSVKKAVQAPTRCLVAAHVIVEHGIVNAPTGALNWAFDNYLRHDIPKDRTLGHEVIVDLGAIDSLTLRVRELSDTTVTKKDYIFESSTNSDPLEVTVANLCLHDPLQWEPGTAKKDPPDDEDFRWHYELVDDPIAFKEKLNNLRAPIPRSTGALPNGNGFNCFPKLFAPVDF